ncbi:MAG: wax ester/triacylglycerol synthase domain-containing protein [Acidimicrobiales bacterium]
MTDTARDIRHERHMTDAEALMWAAEKDPWMSSAMGSVFVLDEAPDFDRLTETMRRASATLLRLRERVEPGLGLAPPRWVVDPEFDVSEHVRRVRLPARGGLRELLDLAAETFSDPFDPSRPLWQFVAVDGSGSRRNDAVNGAIILKLHHSVSDGIGAVRLAEMYLDLDRNPAPLDDVAAGEPDDATSDSSLDRALADITHLAKRPVTIARAAAAEVAMWGADPGRVRGVLAKATALARTAANQVGGSGSAATGSPLWATRSRHRELHTLDLRLDDMRAAAKALDVSINDVFVAGSVLAAARLHEVEDAEVDAFNVSFIVSTRADEAAGGNSFAPLPFRAPSAVLDPAETAREVATAMADARTKAGVGAAAALDMVAGVAVLLPPALLSRAARARAAQIDWATSNLRGVPIPIYVAGGEVTRMYPVGPLAGTAFNLTALSYNGGMYLGLFVDPRAVAVPEDLMAALESAYSDLLSAGER